MLHKLFFITYVLFKLNCRVKQLTIHIIISTLVNDIQIWTSDGHVHYRL